MRPLKRFYLYVTGRGPGDDILTENPTVFVASKHMITTLDFYTPDKIVIEDSIDDSNDNSLVIAEDLVFSSQKRENIKHVTFSDDN